MRQVMVRYKLKPERVAENEKLVRGVYDELAETEPDGLQYATFRLDDGVSFVHIAFETGDGPSPLPSVAAFNEFRSEIRDRCEEPPVTSELTEIGSFRFPASSA
jgi:hypothetical protein